MGNATGDDLNALSAEELAAKFEAEGGDGLIEELVGAKPDGEGAESELESDDAKVKSGEEEEEPEEVEEPEPKKLDKAPEKPEEPAAKVEAKADDKAKDEEPTGIELKSGKVIPYDVLKQTRRSLAATSEQLTTAEATIQQSKTRETELLAEVERLKAAKGVTQDAAEKAANPDDPLAGIDLDDLPDAVANAFRTLGSKITDQNAKLAKAQAVTDKVAQNDDEARRTSVQEAIDENDDLREWSAKHPALWKQAVAQDAILKQDPKWADKTLAERFAKVSVIVRTLNDMPLAKPAADTTTDTKQLDKKAPAKPAKAKPPLSSMTDIPGGSAIGGDVVDSVEDMSARGIAAQMEGKTPAQLEAYLRNFS